MSDGELEARLREVLIQLAEAHAFNVFSEIKKPNPTREAIGKIRQVFKEAGYLKMVKDTYVDPSLITKERFDINRLRTASQEWLTRFKTELDAERQFIPAGMYKLILEIAERTTK